MWQKRGWNGGGGISTSEPLYRFHPLQLFPSLFPENHRVINSPSRLYNCIAWAAGFTDRQLWPGVPELEEEGVQWPADLPQDESLGSVVAFFESLGYQQCDDPDLEDEFEKVAVFADEDDLTHASKQLPSGWWTSKMGWNGVTIEHDSLACIEGSQYGQAVLFLKRPIP